MTPGFHRMTADEYHQDPTPEPSLSSSLAKMLLAESPRKVWYSHPRLNPAYEHDDDDKFDLGTAAHALLLEGLDRMHVCEFDDWRTKAAKEQKAEARAMGKLPLLARHAEAVRKMVTIADAFAAESEIADFWLDAESETTCIWREPGIWLRCRPDRITADRRVCMDYKSTTDASPDGFSRQLIRMGYHHQDAFYRRGIGAVTGRPPTFVFLAQSVEPPHECTLHACDPALQEIADADIARAIDIWRESVTTGNWPSYGGRIYWTVPAQWQMKQHEQRLMEEA